MNLKKKENLFLFFLLFFSVYCAINIGESWDEGYHFLQGKITLDYLLTFGQIDKDLLGGGPVNYLVCIHQLTVSAHQAVCRG